MNQTPDSPGRMYLPFIPPNACDLQVSFEFFPPQTPKMEETLWESIGLLAPLKPSFVSVTYGAGGSTRERTHEVVTHVQERTGLKAAAHLTCIGASKGEIDDIARRYWASGIRHIVALRGDIPPGHAHAKDGYDHASDLIAGLKKIADFEISAAGYPEKHPEAPSIESDIDFLKRKVDAGASRVVTQFFIEPATFLRFRDHAAKAGVNVPIVPGILPVSNYEKTVRFSNACQVALPEWLHTLFTGLDAQPDTRRLVAATVAAEQCRALYAEGIRHFHFYTLNRAELTLAICHMLGLRAA